MASTLKYLAFSLALTPFITSAQTLGNLAIPGKNQWLFYGVEFSDASVQDKTNESVDLIALVNGQLKDNGVALLLALAPIKARIYKQHLPDDKPLTPYLDSNYKRMRDILLAKGVVSADINTAFSDPAVAADSGLYYRLDSHWSQRGALLAGETVKKEIENRPEFKSALAPLPPLPMKLIEHKKTRLSKARDLTQLMSADEAKKYESEPFLPIQFQRTAPSSSLTGAEEVPGVVLVGSSYSQEWTGFPDSIRYYLQKDVGNYSLDASIGQWVGFYRYLQSDAYHLSSPKLVVWEIPERDMVATPDFKYRDARYQMHRIDWSMGATAWAQRNCQAGQGSVKGLGSGAKTAKTKDTTAIQISGAAADTYIDIEVFNAAKGADYIDARVASSSDQTLAVEVVAGKKRSLPTVKLIGDGQAHVLRIPLTSSEGVVTKARIVFSGPANVELSGVRICQHKPLSL
jgi:alginate O-acetyltransferase complex protein AlgJ